MGLKKTLEFFLIILIFFINCSGNDDRINNDLTIYQEGNVKITLVAITDERCPINNNCIWKGNAEVSMRIVKGNETMNFTLNTAGDINEDFSSPNSMSIFDLNIELLDVQPNPKDGVSYTLEEYTISLDVTN